MFLALCDDNKSVPILKGDRAEFITEGSKGLAKNTRSCEIVESLMRRQRKKIQTEHAPVRLLIRFGTFVAFSGKFGAMLCTFGAFLGFLFGGFFSGGSSLDAFLASASFPCASINERGRSIRLSSGSQ